MRKLSSKLSFIIAVAVLVALTCSCYTISNYDETAYQQTTSLKVDVLSLMDKAAEPFAQHSEEVELTKLNLQKVYEYNRGRPKNELSTKQWEILLNPNHNLVGGFFKKWEVDTTLSRSFIEELKGVISDAFDEISGLESGKIKDKDSKLVGNSQ